ncbi:MAG TPA: biotin/lipoyl-binding protein [Bacillota bacterium]|nr:biotin/lipoyl-binding protein [Bacillota bacterium]
MRKTLISIIIIIIAITGYVAYLIYDLQSVTANGTIKAAHIQNIMVDFPAYVNRVCVKDGQLVKAGDVLLTLNIKEYGTEIRQKEQELCNAQSKLQEE